MMLAPGQVAVSDMHFEILKFISCKRIHVRFLTTISSLLLSQMIQPSMMMGQMTLPPRYFTVEQELGRINLQHMSVSLLLTPFYFSSQTWSSGTGAPPPPSMSRSSEHDDRDERDYERRRRRERSRERGRGRSRSRSRSRERSRKRRESMNWRERADEDNR